MTIQFIFNGIIAGFIFGFIALGFAIIYRSVKFFHFSHGIIYTVCAYFAYTFLITCQLNIVLSVFLSIILGALLGVLIDRLVYRPLRKRKASNMVLMLSSFGIFIFLQNLIQLIYGANVLSIRTSPIKVGNEILGAIITDMQLVILFVSLILLLIVWLFIKKARLGKAISAVSDDPIAANVVGINSEKIILLSFAIGSALAGIAGILISYETNIEPTMGFSALLKGIIACIIGGIGSLPGAVLGGFFLGIVENLGIWFLPSEWKDTIAFTVLILFLLFRPWGILGNKSDREII